MCGFCFRNWGMGLHGFGLEGFCIRGFMFSPRVKGLQFEVVRVKVSWF